MGENRRWPFVLPTADQLSIWMMTEKHMIDNISSSQGFISGVEHKTRNVTKTYIHYILARCDGLHANRHQLAPLISEHLHLPYQPWMYRPHGKPEHLVLDLENGPATAYARAVLSTGITMTLHGNDLFFYPVKDVGMPDEEMMYDFQIEERKATATEHLKIRMYGLPLHLWTIRAIERVLQPHCIVERVSPANLNFRKLGSVSCTGWAIRCPVPFPWYILVHVSSKYDKGKNQNSSHVNTETFCVGVDTTTIEQHRHTCSYTPGRRIPSFLHALERGMVSHSYLNEVDIPADQMEILNSAFLLTSCNEEKIMTEDKLTHSLQQMQKTCPGEIIAKQVNRFKYLIYFKGPVTTSLFHTLSSDTAGVHLPFGMFLVQKWTTSLGAVSSILSRRVEISITGLPTEFYNLPVIEDILSAHCIVENNNHQSDDSPDVWFYDCAIWTDKTTDIPEIISLCAAPDGLAVEPSAFRGLQLPLELYHARIIQR